MVKPLWEIVWQFLKKLNRNLPHKAAISLPGMYPREMKPYVLYVHSNTYTWIVTEALFIITKTTIAKCTLTGE
jgi:hypothetical protein